MIFEHLMKSFGYCFKAWAVYCQYSPVNPSRERIKRPIRMNCINTFYIAAALDYGNNAQNTYEYPLSGITVAESNDPERTKTILFFLFPLQKSSVTRSFQNDLNDFFRKHFTSNTYRRCALTVHIIFNR